MLGGGDAFTVRMGGLMVTTAGSSIGSGVRGKTNSVH